MHVRSGGDTQKSNKRYPGLSGFAIVPNLKGSDMTVMQLSEDGSVFMQGYDQNGMKGTKEKKPPASEDVSTVTPESLENATYYGKSKVDMQHAERLMSEEACRGSGLMKNCESLKWSYLVDCKYEIINFASSNPNNFSPDLNKSTNKPETSIDADSMEKIVDRIANEANSALEHQSLIQSLYVYLFCLD